MKPIIVAKVVQTCGACPSQWEGETADGKYVYARYRSGRMRVDVAPSEAEWTNGRDDCVYREDLGDALDGYISYEELKAHTAGVLEWPESDG